MTTASAAVSRPRLLTILCLLALFAAASVLTVTPKSGDLLALWLAGESHARNGQIYPPAGTLFTIRPPEDWAALAQQAGYDGAVFPYLYPPLWAALIGWLSPDWSTLRDVARVVNPLLLLGVSVLFWRAMQPRLGLVPFVLIGQALLYSTVVGGVAVLENQPQILVTFLTVLAIERVTNGAPITGGAALALAAALKLLPAVLVIIWIVSGERRASLAFLVAGAGLAAASVALAGWPLHEVFLATVSQVARTAATLPITFGFDALLMSVLRPEDAVIATGVVTQGSSELPSSPLVALKDGGWAWAGRIGLVTALVAGAAAARSLPARETVRSIWPALLVAAAFFSPLAWAYYYIPALAAAPYLLERHGPRIGALAIGLPAGAVTVAALSLWQAAGIPFHIVGSVAMAALGAAFLLPGASGPRGARQD